MTRQILSLILLLILSCGGFLQANDTKPANLEKPDHNTIPEQITDFKTCALTSLRRTPQLQRTRMEIDIRRLDEEDSRWSYFPTLQLSSYYYLSEDQGTISFHAVNYRPWEPYYSLQAQKLITEIVMLKHVQATAQSLYELADTFLQLHTLSQIDNYYQKIIDLSQKKLKYAENRRISGLTSPLELEVEKQTLATLTAEHRGILIKREALLDGLCIAMNLPDRKIFALDSSIAFKQIMGSSGVAALTSLSSPEDSLNQQIIRKQQLLQEKKILLAYSQYMPDFSLGVRSPDVINEETDTENSYFFYLGMSLTLWDGNKRARDITRQEMLLRQMEYEKREVENGDSLAWRQATEQFSLAKTEYTMSQSIENLNNLQLKKKESEYNTGTIKLPDFINYQIEMHRDKINIIQKELVFYKAGLKLRHLSGQLLKETINISLADVPYE